ncbi:MAG: ABC transporter permease subunit [Dermatophilaceae bacterium]
MMRLTRVELRRLFSRRLTTIALLGALILTGLMLFDSFQRAKPLSGSELTSQRAQFDQAHKDWEANGAQQVQDCLAANAAIQKTDPKAVSGCDNLEPRWENWGKQQAKFAELMPSTLQAGSALLMFVGFLVGASFVAAEFSSGSMANWLTFEPRRMRVYASKLAAAGLGLMPATVALLGLLTAGVWLIVHRFNPTGGTTTKVWGDLGEMGARTVALALAATLAGAAIGVLLRRTVAVLGIAVAYIVLVEGVFGQALQGARPWLLQLNVTAWLQHSATYYVDSCATDAQGNYTCQGVEKVLSFGHSSAYLGLLVVFAVGLAALVFRRRDVS